MVALSLSLDVLAVGLGKLRVQSALDQPLEAEIELISVTQGELNTLSVAMAAASEFTRAGIEQVIALDQIVFEAQQKSDGTPYVKLSSALPITDPFLHFLVSLDWAGGKLIREYTVLLDPPLYAQGRPASISSPRLAGQRSSGSTLIDGQVVVSNRPAAQSATSSQEGNVFGPISRGDTLSSIVARLDLPSSANVFQAMFALLRKNPNAFILGNINLIKEGSTLRLPTLEEIESISSVVASSEYTQHLNEWLAYRNDVQRGLVNTDGGTQSSTALGTGQVARAASSDGESDSGLSEDILRIIQSDGGQAGAESSATGSSGEMSTLRSQLALMEESLLSTELENNDLKGRLGRLEIQIKETNKLLKVQNGGLALAENNAATSSNSTDNSQDDDEQALSSQQSDSGIVRRVSSSTSFLKPITDMLGGDMLWKVLLGLAALVLLIGIMVYMRRRQSYAEFEETMMTGSTYDLRNQSSTYTQMPRMDTVQHSQPSVRTDSQTGSLMQTSFMTEMGAPGMGAMQSDEVDPIAEAEVYMAYGRDQQAMEVLQDAIRRDPGRTELKIKLLEVYQKRKDVRAFESLAEELYGVIGKDPTRWGRVSEMGRRLTPKHPLFSGAAGGGSISGSNMLTQQTQNSTSEISGLGSGLDFVSAPFSRSTQASPPSPPPHTGSLDLPSSGALDFSLGGDSGIPGASSGFGLDLDSIGGGMNIPSMPASSTQSTSMRDSDAIDDFKFSEIATKLDLAKAYMEMGDRDAAKGFIDEVLKEGSEAQRQQASELASNF